MDVTNPAARLAALRQVPLFRGLAKATLIEVARRSQERTFAAGTRLVEEGDPGDSLWVIVEGAVDVRHGGVSIAKMGPGEYFGEISLIDGMPRSATVVASDEVVALTLSTDDFDALMNIPHVARAALEGLAARLRAANRRGN